MIEVERKFRLAVGQKSEIEQALIAQYGPLEAVHQVDQVFLQGVSSFAEFTPGDPVMRLRTTGAKATLAYKRTINEAGDTVEHEVSVGPSSVMAEILEEMGFQLVTTVAKDRLFTEAGKLALMLDNVIGVGDFFEIEALLEDESEQPAAEKLIMDKAAEFGLTAEAIETRKYDQLVSVQLSRRPESP